MHFVYNSLFLINYKSINQIQYTMRHIIFLILILSNVSFAQKKDDNEKKNKKKSYAELIDDSFKTDDGLFRVHHKDQLFYY